LDESVDKIETATNDLESISQISEVTKNVSHSIKELDENFKYSINNIENGFSQLATSFEDRVSYILDVMGGQVSNVHVSIEETRTDILNLLKSEDSERHDEDKQESVLHLKNLNVSKLSIRLKFTLYAIYLTQVYKGTDVEEKGLPSWLVENDLSLWDAEDNDAVENTYAYYCAIMENYLYLDLFSIELNTNSIINFNLEIQEEIKKSIEKNDEMKRKLDEMEELFKKYSI
jgi:hypothetical protein